MKDYTFDGGISKQVLENYLSKAVTAANLINSDTLEDDLRFIKNIGAKFMGRVSGIWDMEKDDEEHFRKSEGLANKIHEHDSEIILQTCIFEAIFRELEEIKIPAWVFEVFNIPCETRNFRFDDMLFDSKPLGFINENSALPNIDKLEVQMWFYYRAVRYIDAGFEAIHMGQIHLYSADAVGYKKVFVLFDMIRKYAKKNARRHMVILDAHTHGVNVKGKLLFDFHSMPFSRMPILDVGGDKLAFVREGFSEGGLTPSGWKCDTLPLLMEFDNWGGKFFNEDDNIPYEKRAWMEWWGYDQITWFATQDEESRNQYLEYAFKWTTINDVNAYCQMPFRRGIGSCKIKMQALGTDKEMVSDVYKANMPSKACPLGFGQEETIKRIWESTYNLRERVGNPALRTRGYFGSEDIYQSSTGIKLPPRVILFGNFQHHVGAFNNDSNSETTRMYHLGDGIYTLTCILLYKGEYEYAVSNYGTLSQVYSIDNYPRSGSSTKAKIKVEKDNAVIKFTYDFINRKVKSEVIEEI